MSVLKLKYVYFSYHSLAGEIYTLENINFSIKKGEFLAIVGPSGCGKSTLLNLIIGLLQPQTGSITFDKPPGSPPSIGYMLQHDHLFE